MNPEIIELSGLARDEGKLYAKKRPQFKTISDNLGGGVFVGLIGARGSGKTVLLKQLLWARESAVYVSLDTVSLDGSLFELAKELAGMGVKLLLLDEVHGLHGFEAELKKIHDFLAIDVVFTSSSALSLHQSSYDLSRRVHTVSVPPLPLWERLYLEKDWVSPPFKLDDLMSLEKSREYLGRTLNFEGFFEEYLRGGNFPFTLGKKDVLPLFRNILETVLNQDILMGGRASREETFEMRRMLAFIGKSPAEDISYSSIARNVGVTKYKAEKYSDLLEKSFILKRIPPKGTNVTKEPKIMMTLPYRLLYRGYEDCLGSLREDFFTDAITNLGEQIYYLKSKRGEKTPDYLVGDAVFEIGGKTKSQTQFKGFSGKTRIILSHPGGIEEHRRPLFMAGMLRTG